MERINGNHDIGTGARPLFFGRSYGTAALIIEQRSH
jgi:hypothetical protein